MTELMSDLAYVISILSLCFIAMICFVRMYRSKPETIAKKKIVFMKCEDIYLNETYFIDNITPAKSRLGERHARYHSDLYDKEDDI